MYNHGYTATKTTLLPDLATTTNGDCEKAFSPQKLLHFLQWYVERKIPSASTRTISKFSSCILYDTDDQSL